MTGPQLILWAAVAFCWAAAGFCWWVARQHRQRRDTARLRALPRWADQLTADPDDDRDRRPRKRWGR